jgi:hypothetical protein
VEECPHGYPCLAAFLSSESSFSLYRGFSYAHSRVLLDLQAQVVLLERELDRLDLLDSRNGEDEERRLHSRASDIVHPRIDSQRPREEVLRDLQEKLGEYDELLIKAREIASFQRPSTRDYRSVRAWFHNVEPLVEKEAQFITLKEDIVSIRSGREWSTFDGWIESTLRRFDCPLLRVRLGSQKQHYKFADGSAEVLLLSRAARKNQRQRHLLLLIASRRALRQSHYHKRDLCFANTPRCRNVPTHKLWTRHTRYLQCHWRADCFHAAFFRRNVLPNKGEETRVVCGCGGLLCGIGSVY